MGSLAASDYIGFCVKQKIPGNMPKPSVSISSKVALIFDPSGSIVDGDLAYYDGSSGNPGNDSGGIGGAIDTGSELNQSSNNILIGPLTVAGTDQEYRGIAYLKNEHASVSMDNAAVALIVGGELPASNLVLTLSSTSASDTGPVRLCFKASTNWETENVTLTGTTPVNSGNQIDVNSDWYAVYNNGAVPVGDIYIYCGSTIIGVIYGQHSCYMASSLNKIALATAKNATVSATNRKTDPASGISSFGRGTYWSGNDSSLAVP